MKPPGGTGGIVGSSKLPLVMRFAKAEPDIPTPHNRIPRSAVLRQSQVLRCKSSFFIFSLLVKAPVEGPYEQRPGPHGLTTLRFTRRPFQRAGTSAGKATGLRLFFETFNSYKRFRAIYSLLQNFFRFCLLWNPLVLNGTKLLPGPLPMDFLSLAVCPLFLLELPPTVLPGIGGPHSLTPSPLSACCGSVFGQIKSVTAACRSSCWLPGRY
jgi:hypothetical protein